MDAKLNHSDLTALLAKQVAISATKADAFTKAFFDIILEGLDSDGIVKINGLGTFKVTDVASRSSVDVNTGEKIEIKGHRKLTFTPADSLKDCVNKPFAMFEPVEIDDTYVDEEPEPGEEAQDVATADDAVTTVAPASTTTIEEAPAEEISQAEPLHEEKPVAEAETKTGDVADSEKGKEHKPKKAGKPFLVTLLIIVVLVAIAALFKFMPSARMSEQTVAVTEKPAANKNNIVETPATPVVADTVPLQQETEEEYAFLMVDELEARSVGSIGVQDTLLYTADGALTVHTVAENETLTRIALKYYGDKKLWPYIVQYNRLDNPNGLCKGMNLEIPRLFPVK